MAIDYQRAYLVIPKLIIQPTWGGSYIAGFKNIRDREPFRSIKIGQSYELFSSSNVSLATDSSDPSFVGEIVLPQDTHKKTSPPNTIALADLIAANPQAVLGTAQKDALGIKLLIKFTQALGNSFQLHVKEGVSDTYWKSKPESWYFFEPGSITLGVKRSINWEEYENKVSQLNDEMLVLSFKVRSKTIGFTEAKMYIEKLLATYNPWQFVNVLDTPKNTLIDLTPCGIHHSWEENPKLPQGNIVYELQVDISDSSSTIRNFDKGKMQEDGTVRPLHIEEYFRYIDRSESANDPTSHLRKPKLITESDVFSRNRMMENKYYTLDEVVFKKAGSFSETIGAFRHVFVKSGAIQLTTGTTTISIGRGHSAFIPAGVLRYTAAAEGETVVLISFV